MALTAETDLRQDLVMLSRTDPSVPTDVEASEAINALRFLAVDAVEHAGSGHPGTAMALAPLAYRLFTRHLCQAKPDGERMT
jgi:transketolase